MTEHENQSEPGPQPMTSSQATRSAEQNQLDFEIEFYAGILENHPDYIDVLRIQGNNLTLKGRYAEGLQIDMNLIRLRPHDPLVHYNLACSYALLNRKEQSIVALEQAIELGYRDFRYLREDRDLDSIRQEPRFRKLMLLYEEV